MRGSGGRGARTVIRAALAAVIVALVNGQAAAREPTGAVNDAQIRSAIVQESVASYLASGRPCACPYSAMRNGAACGGRSAYSRPGGATPFCYPGDVPDAMVSEYRRRGG